MPGIIVAGLLWLVVTVVTPAKIRPFISSVCLLVVFAFAYFVYKNGSGNDGVTVPARGKAEAFTLSWEDFDRLSQPSGLPDTLTLPGLDVPLAAGRTLLTHRDFDAQTLELLKDQPDFEAFSKGRIGLTLFKVPARLKDSTVIPEHVGARFSPLPFIDVTEQLEATQRGLADKQGVIDKIRAVIEASDLEKPASGTPEL